MYHPPARSRGYALVLVLIIVSFAAAIAILFLLSAQQERTGTDSYAEGSRVRQLASTAVNIVMGQITTATKQGTMSAPISWASQPGMIRTYDTTGGLHNAFKLYSWPTMVESSSFNPQDTSQLPPSTWYSVPAQYTDMNLPVNGVYPIVDPAAATQVEDFSIDNTNVAATAGASPKNTAPMPVQWAYVLQDGTWVFPTTVSGSTATFDPAVVTGTNTIVGRIAFWTDDETCKVNINTASEGAYWDWPKAASQDEMQLAGNPPVKNEFNRIAGHPATTSLSAVFPEMRNGTFNRWTATSTYAQQLQNIFSLTPRVNWGLGGSQGGTFPITSYSQSYEPAYGSYVLPSTYSPIALEANRLYATADELWFQPTLTSGTRAATPLTTYGITETTLSQRLFFLTANSTAPETTLFETPRISLWPLTYPNKSSFFYPFNTGMSYSPGGIGGLGGRGSPPATTYNPNSSGSTILGTLASASYLTPQEELIDFCSTLNPTGTTTWEPYYFQRLNPDSPTNDWANITRNQNLVTYLRNEMGQTPPGIGSGLSLASKWGANNADWIALNCFDFSRSLINQYTYDPNSTTGNLLYSYTGVSLRSGSIANTPLTLYSEPNTATVVPLRASLNGNTYVTEGAYPTLKEVALMFMATSRNMPVKPTDPKTLYAGEWSNLITLTGSAVTGTGNTQTTSMQAVMLLSFAGLNPGSASYSPVFWVKVSGSSFGTSGAPITGGSFSFPSAGGSSIQVDMRTTGNNTNPNFASLIYKQYNQPKNFTNGATGASSYSLISNPITIDPTKGLSFTFTGTPVTISFYAPYSTNMDTDPTGDANQLISTQTVDFSKWSSTTLPIPLAPRWNENQGSMIVQNPGTTGATLSTSGTIVPMPDAVLATNALPPTTIDSAQPGAPSGWAIEIAPGVGAYNGLSSAALLSADPLGGSLPVPTVTGSTSFNNNFGNGGGGQVIYALQGTVTAPASNAPSLSYSPALGVNAAGFTGISTDIRCRVAALTDVFSDTKQFAFAAEGSGNGLFGTSAADIRGTTLITPYDTVISMVPDPAAAAAGDQRLMGRGNAILSSSFVRIDTAMNAYGFTPNEVIRTATGKTNYTVASGVGTFPMWNTYRQQFHQFGMPEAYLPMITGYVTQPTVGGTVGPAYTNPLAARGRVSVNGNPPVLGSRDFADASVSFEGNVTLNLNLNQDWTSLPGWDMDGAYIQRPDQDYQCLSQDYSDQSGQRVPYFMRYGTYSTTVTSTGAKSATSSDFFTPNRQVPSPIVLGTLPSDMNTGWQTLAFSPNPAKTMNGGTHPGTGTFANLAAPAAADGAPYTNIPDHLLLDLFWMPVAEPYPISANFATAGKVNLNYAMMPFSYIQRKTALDAVLKSVWLYALPLTGAGITGTAASYKSYYHWNVANGYSNQHTRYPIAVDETLKGFDAKFNTGDIFRSASQICDMFLYPNAAATGATAAVTPNSPLVTYDSANANITGWWKTQQLTSDNGREAPYDAIYSRVTTKSNTYTVHWKVQALRKVTGNGSNPATWTEGSDRITSELRGSTLIERYLDPNATNIPDYASYANLSTSGVLPMSAYYKWRVDAETYFQPHP